MKTLVVGASGATGQKLIAHLLDKKQFVKIIVRSKATLPGEWKQHNQLEVIEASLLDMTARELEEAIYDCQAVASCLGHNLTFKGIYGEPRKLVRDAIRNLTTAAEQNKPDSKIRFVLMNTTANRNRDLNEPVSFVQKIIMALIRLLLPPQVDNEQAAEFLRTKIGRDHPFIEWVAVRPDSLINENELEPYEVFASPIRSALFNPGKTSRTQVGHFMAELITVDDVWQKWKGQMPVIYKKETTKD